MQSRPLPLLCAPLLLLALSAQLWAVPNAHAESPPKPPAGSLSSEELIQRAQALFKEQKYSEAGDALMLASEQKPQAVLLFNAGQAYRKALRPVEAKNAYSKMVDTYPDHPLVPEAKGYIQTLDALIAEVQAKQQIELSLSEQKAKSEKELAEERARREAVQQELKKYQAPFYKRAWFWLLVSGGVIVAGAVVAGGVGSTLASKTQGGTQHLQFALTF